MLDTPADALAETAAPREGCVRLWKICSKNCALGIMQTNNDIYLFRLITSPRVIKETFYGRLLNNHIYYWVVIDSAKKTTSTHTQEILYKSSQAEEISMMGYATEEEMCDGSNTN